MKLLFLALVGLVAGERLNSQLNPITRVAQLLEGMAKKVAEDGEGEQNLYDKYKCWCTKVMNAKAISMDANSQRISELAAYIDDLANGRIELTSERTDLEAEIKELEKAIAEEEALREQEHEDYLAAKDEMDKAIAGLDGAIQVLGDATKDPKEGVIGDATKVLLAAKLKKVMKVGSGFLAKTDVSELLKALDVPEVDWEKLNQPATHKQKYSARSGKIQDILADMQATFTDNRDAAVAAEDKAKADFDTLHTAKQEQMDAAKQALLDKFGEGGARSQSLAESEQEKSDLEGQNERDTKFSADTKAACEKKSSEWSERKRLRAEEIASINQAIATLRSDDARDLMSKTVGFIQLSNSKHERVTKFMALIRRTAASSGDARVAVLSTMLAGQEPEAEIDEANPFTAVLAAVDKMIGDLKAEEADDLARKNQCETDRQENTQNAKMSSKKIDTNTETVDRLEAAIAAANKQIEEINEQVAGLEEDKRDAADQRAKEALEHEAAQKDNAAAIGLLENAVGVLQDFYQKNGLALAQMAQEPFVEAGEAPTPPPSTWDTGYGGSKGESNGIVAIMEIIKADIEKDMGKADADEKESIGAYDSFVADVDANLKSLHSSKADLEGAIANNEGEMIAEKTTKVTNKEDLQSTLDFLKEIAPGCDFIAVNFDTRLKNRQAEIDGLSKARAILEGADFGL